MDFLRVGDFGGLGDSGGERFVGMLDFVFLLSESRKKIMINKGLYMS